MVCLTDEARQQLQEVVQSGTRPVRVMRRALILLKSDAGLTDLQVVEHVGCGERTVRILSAIGRSRVPTGSANSPHVSYQG